MTVSSKWVRVALIVVAFGAARCGRASTDGFFAIADTPASPKLIRIEVRGVNDVTIAEVGPTTINGCAALAGSSSGTLYSVCGPGLSSPGSQTLATVDPKSGRATAVGQGIDGLQIMGATFGADGRLYVVGDTNPASPTFNSLYTIDVNRGTVTRIGSTGAPSFFHDLALDGNGVMYASSGDAVYTIDVKSGVASKVADFVGGGMVMGLSFNADRGKLYATDWKRPTSDVYLVDLHTGFLTPVGATGYPLSHGLIPAPR